MFSFSYVDPDLDILFENLIARIGNWIWKTPFPHYPLGVGDFMQSLSFLFTIFSGDLYLDACWLYRAFLDLPGYGLDSWRRSTLKGDCWCIEGEMER